MAYIALLDMETAAGQRKAGDLVPEATKWHNLRSWVNKGHLAFVTEGQEKAFIDALKSGGDALQYAPLSKPHHVAGAARRLQLGVEAESRPSVTEASAPAASQEQSTPFNRAVSGKRQKDG